MERDANTQPTFSISNKEFKMKKRENRRLEFDEGGRLKSVDNRSVADEKKRQWKNYGKRRGSPRKLMTSADLVLDVGPAIEPIFNEGWSLFDSNGENLEPLRFSNGKTQEDVVNEVVGLVRGGKKIIFIHGTCGTGKCLDGQSRIFCKPEDEKSFGYYKISDLVGKEGKAISVDNSGRTIESSFMKVRSTGKKPLYRLTTNTGREVTASSNHPFLTITENGIEWLPLEKLTEKSYICLPNKFSLKNEDSLDENEIRVLAHLIAEGKLGDKSGSPKYYQDKIQNPLIRKDYEIALQGLFPDGELKSSSEKEVTIKFGNMDTRFGTTNKLRLFIRKFGLDGKRSKDKFVPKEIFNLPKEKIALFLRILFSCDGCIYTKKNANRKNQQIIVEYTSISKDLIEDVSILLNGFGINHTISFKKFRENPRYAWRILISGQTQLKEFIERIGFIGRKQKLALELCKECDLHKFSNIDKVPRIVREYLKNKGYSYNELDRFLNYEEIERLRKDKAYKKIRRDKSVETPQVFKQAKIDFLRYQLKKVNEHIDDSVISFICSDNIIWDKIKSVDFLKEDETYDLEVPEYHNFIANGIVVHNSAIALNIARELGRASIVVPIKSLQRQYEEDYLHKKYVLKKNGKKMKIAMITGRDNHDSLFIPGTSCANPDLPDTIQITAKNSEKLKEYYDGNPFIRNKREIVNVGKLRRVSIAPVNPYWSPIVSASYELKQLEDAVKKRYMGLNGREFIFYHRKEGCSYYDQYQSYIDADVLIFNSAKYKIETVLDRKPSTDVEIIDECDEFLDNFANQQELNLTRLERALRQIMPSDEEGIYFLDKAIELAKMEIKNKEAIGIDENAIFPIGETKVKELLKLVLKPELECEIIVDEANYSNRAVEAAKDFEDFFDDTYVSFRKHEDNLYVEIVTTNVSEKLKEMIGKNKIFVFMSGTLHSPKVLEHIFGLKDFEIVEAEGVNQGVIEIHRTGQEFDCRYSNLVEGRRSDYLCALNACLVKAIKPTLIHVNAFKDLPLNKEIGEFGVHGLVSRERLLDLQGEDKTGGRISMFKKGLIEDLFTTKCSRGIDFPGAVCRSVVFTKYPNPNVNDIFWKVLKETHKDWYWEFYRDKARRDFLQKIYRAVRSPEDHVFVLSPDIRVLNAVRKIQEGNGVGG